MKYFQKAGLVASLAAMTLLAACGGKSDDKDDKEKVDLSYPYVNPYPSTYTPYESQSTLIENVTLFDGRGHKIENAQILLHDNKIAGVSEKSGGKVKLPKGLKKNDLVKVDGTGKFVSPGIIDVHSHLGVYPSPDFSSTSDGNEATAPNTAGVWAEHSVWPHDPGFSRALAGGVTSMQILPGSANLFGGRSVTLKNVPGRTVQEMKFPDAPYGLKMACGENPKRVYDSRGPSTRMGNFRGYRGSWQKAVDYKRKWDKWIEEGDADADMPDRDLQLETLMMALNGELNVHMHCYRGDEMAQIIDMSKEFGYNVRAFHHVVEGYKVADMLAENDICAAVWADWWGFKLEAYDSVRENAALIHNQEGSCAIIHSDSDIGIQRLNQEAAKAMADGQNLGIDITPEVAMMWITYNAAKGIGVEAQTGSIEVGKMADIVLWDGNPFSVYTKAERVWIDGSLMFDKYDMNVSPRMDFEIGQQGNGKKGGSGQ